MKPLRLVGRRVAHFAAVLFLSSLLLSLFLWVSPASPGRPSQPLFEEDVVVGGTVGCLLSECGVVQTVSGEAVTLSVAGRVVQGELRYLKAPGPGFGRWFFGTFWGGLLRGDVGDSESMQMPVLRVVREGLAYTLPIVAAALLAALLTSTFIAWLLNAIPLPAVRSVVRAAALVASITPVFILGYILQTNGVLPHRLTPVVLAATIGILFVGDGNLADVLIQLEDEIRTLRNKDYVHAAVLRGAPLWRHMLPGILLPVTSVSAAKIAFLLGSVVIAERLFAVPGLGDASLVAAEKNDALLLVTLTLFVTAVVAAVALLRDVAEILIDPRLRRSAADGG